MSRDSRFYLARCRELATRAMLGVSPPAPVPRAKAPPLPPVAAAAPAAPETIVAAASPPPPLSRIQSAWMKSLGRIPGRAPEGLPRWEPLTPIARRR